MDYTLLWYGISLAINDVLNKNIGYLTTYVYTAEAGEVKDNTYSYSVFVTNPEHEGFIISIVYNFCNNNFTVGNVTITVDNTTERTYSLIRNNHGFKVYKDTSYCVEFYPINDSNILTIHKSDNKKVEIGNLTIVENDDLPDKSNTGVLNSISIDISKTPQNFNELDHVVLFAVSGIVDKANKFNNKFHDVIKLSTSSTTLLIFNGTVEEVVIIYNTSKEHVGEISVINSDFKQKYNYKYFPYDKEYLIEEYVLSRHLREQLKRKYRCCIEDDTLTALNNIYHIHTNNTNNIIFS